jgi:hypothetical protein
MTWRDRGPRSVAERGDGPRDQQKRLSPRSIGHPPHRSTAGLTSKKKAVLQPFYQNIAWVRQTMERKKQ